MDNHSLCILNDGSYTYLHPGYGTYTAIDLTITQPNLLLDFSWRVLDDLCGSDHFPIVIKHQGPATGGREPGWRLKIGTGSARKSYVKLLDPVHHQGLRLSLGVFRTSPIQSLYVEAREPSLENRRLKLSQLNSRPIH